MDSTKAMTRSVLLAVAGFFAFVGVAGIVQGLIDVGLLAFLIAGGVYWFRSRIPVSEIEQKKAIREEAARIRKKQTPNAVEKKLSEIEAKQRGDKAAEDIIACIRRIEKDRGPYATVKWRMGEDDVYVTTEGSSQTFKFSLRKVTGLDLHDSTAMERIMGKVALGLHGEHEALSYEV